MCLNKISNKNHYDIEEFFVVVNSSIAYKNLLVKHVYPWPNTCSYTCIKLCKVVSL